MVSARKPGGPGTPKHEEAVDLATKVMVITVHGKPYRFAPGNVPPMEKVIVQEATGVSYERWLGDGKNIGEASVLVFCWLAERAKGNKFLTLEQFADKWVPLRSADDIEVQLLDADDKGLPGDDPES